MVEVTLKATSCEICGVPFAIPDYLHAGLQESKAGFCCPNGHRLRFKGASLSEQLEEARREAAVANSRWNHEIEASDRLKKRLRNLRKQSKK